MTTVEKGVSVGNQPADKMKTGGMKEIRVIKIETNVAIIMDKRQPRIPPPRPRSPSSPSTCDRD